MDIWKVGVVATALTYYYQESKNEKGKFAPKWWQTALTAAGIGAFLYATRDNPTKRAAGLTAAPRNEPSPALQFAIDRKLLATPALDWGSGQGDDAIHMRELGIKAHAYDPYWSPEKPDIPESFSYAQLSFVLDVIPSDSKRIETIKEVLSYMRPGATLVTSVITESRLRFHEREMALRGVTVSRYSDGILFNGRTFMRGFSPSEIVDLLQRAGVKNVQHETILVKGKPDYIVAWGTK